MTLRQHEKYGDVLLSVQASATHYCEPRVSHQPLEYYVSVEVALLDKHGEFWNPEAWLSSDLVALFRDGPVAGHVSQADVDRIREQLKARMVP